MIIKKFGDKIVLYHNENMLHWNKTLVDEQELVKPYGWVQGRKPNESVFSGTYKQLYNFLTAKWKETAKQDNEIKADKELWKLLLDNLGEVVNGEFADVRIQRERVINRELGNNKRVLELFSQELDLFNSESEKLFEARAKIRKAKKITEMREYEDSPCGESFCWNSNENECRTCIFYNRRPSIRYYQPQAVRSKILSIKI